MVAVVAPLSFTLIGADPNISFWASFFAILKKVFPLLIAPFILAVLTRWLFPKANEAINRHKNISFYIWAVSLTVVISRAIGLLLTQFQAHRMMFIWTLWRPCGWWTSVGPEEHRACHLDGAELSQPLVQHCPYALRDLAEPLQQFPDDAKG